MVFGHAGTKESSPWVLPGLSSPAHHHGDHPAGVLLEQLAIDKGAYMSCQVDPHRPVLAMLRW